MRQGDDSKAGLSGFWVIPIMQGSLSLQRTLPKPVKELPCNRQPVLFLKITNACTYFNIFRKLLGFFTLGLFYLVLVFRNFEISFEFRSKLFKEFLIFVYWKKYSANEVDKILYSLCSLYICPSL